MQLDKAFKLVDEYNNPSTSEARIDTIVAALYKAGYSIRPLDTLIIHDETHVEHLNAGSRQWGLVDRRTRRPVERPKAGRQSHSVNCSQIGSS